ncbi:pyridoxal phosphate-dependent decarboxylase family protein [Sinosporangium siamense]|uniref:Amino acid decarboxylase n=1 Tax=Sinosporangium siamense TaxID=1367973 RepID=A0A919V9B0_9ACTN|nr:aminotransferase class V-fold PLP-dependent enzyme [Sinosporangium siamense]GII95101.1 amino acid decarboxylase [Sinosporangium siamense]
MTPSLPLSEVLAALDAGAAERGGPVPATTPAALADLVRRKLGAPIPEKGTGAEEAVKTVVGLLAYGAADPADPRCAAHLHCPPLPEAVAADLAVSLLNQSLDSWDQAPAAVTMEREVVRALAGLAGYGEAASGTVTTGGTESNLMGLMLARDAADSGARKVVFCSETAHFSVRRAAALLGLGEGAVQAVRVDGRRRMDVHALDAALAACVEGGDVPIAVVATAGTTDCGAIDPLPEIARTARRYGAWSHVDAAHGGGALFSDRLSPLLRGLADADSVSIDMHKFGWVPAAAGVFLVRDAAMLAPLELRAAYLNPADDEEEGYDGLLGLSLRTTRRPDCVKILTALRALGRAGMGERVDRCHDLAVEAAHLIAADPGLELVAAPVLSTVVFRYRGTDAVNAALRRRLLAEGRAVVGRTEMGGRICLKLTLLNPAATADDLREIVHAVVAAGHAEESETR